jgi:hypothetical protein
MGDVEPKDAVDAGVDQLKRELRMYNEMKAVVVAALAVNERCDAGNLVRLNHACRVFRLAQEATRIHLRQRRT